MSSPIAPDLPDDPNNLPDHLTAVRTPALVVDLAAFDRNVDAMRGRWPGTSLRPHVKAFKSTALARRLSDAGHTAFCAATPREIEGMAQAGLGADLLLANETLDTERLGRLSDTREHHRCGRLRRHARRGDPRRDPCSADRRGGRPAAVRL